MIRVIHPGAGFWLFTHPGSRGRKGTGSRIRIAATGTYIVESVLRILDWIRIRWGQWIRIRIKEGKNDPQKQKKVEKFHVFKCWMFSFQGWRLLLLLGRPLWGPRVKLIKIFDHDWYSARCWIRGINESGSATPLVPVTNIPTSFKYYYLLLRTRNFVPVFPMCIAGKDRDFPA
jgi:hypothetical protein